LILSDRIGSVGLHHPSLFIFCFFLSGESMSQPHQFAIDFGCQVTTCIQRLNSTSDPTERFNALLALQAAFNILRTRPSGARPYDPDVVNFVAKAKYVLDFLFDSEIRRHHFYCEHLMGLRRENYISQQPQPPLPPLPPPQN
jgi:hypothetical protein